VNANKTLVVTGTRGVLEVINIDASELGKFIDVDLTIVPTGMTGYHTYTHTHTHIHSHHSNELPFPLKKVSTILINVKIGNTSSLTISKLDLKKFQPFAAKLLWNFYGFTSLIVSE
jgi:choice-of-anchor A domain-containing protein